MSRSAAPAAVAPGMSRSITTVMVGNLFPPLVSVLSGPILAQSLGLEGRGFVAAATAPFALITAVVTLGVPDAVTYAIARNNRAATAVLRRGMALLAAAAAVAVVVVVLASPALSGGDADVRRLMLLASAAIVPNMMVGALRGAASALREWRLVTAERVTGATLKLALLIPFWLTDTLTPLVAVLILSAVPVLGALPYVRLRRVWPGSLEQMVTPEARVRGLASFGVRVWAGSISGIVLSRVDQLLMTPLSGPEQLALYVVAVSIAELPLIVNSAVRDVTFVTEVVESKNERLATTARISSFVCLLVAVVIGTSMVWWLPLLFGDDFAGAVPVAGVLLVAVVAGTPGSIAGSGLSGRGRPGLRSWSLAVACLLNIAVLVVLVPILGAVGAAVATLVGNLVASNLNLVFLWRFFGVRPAAFYGLRRGDLGLLAASVRAVLARVVGAARRRG